MMYDLGLFDRKKINAKGVEVSPRDVAAACLVENLTFPDEKDLIVLRTTVKGIKGGQPTTLEYEVIDFHDDETGFSAMARGTSFPATVVTSMMAHGETPAGAIPLETSVNQDRFLEELDRRGIVVARRTL